LQAAAAAGLDVIVVDHHEAEAKLPTACAVINPNRIDDDSGQGQLAAVGVAFLLAVAVNRALRAAGWYKTRAEPELTRWLDLVALGTVCDVVPLTGVNRALVTQGLKVMAARGNPGLRALADVAGLNEPPGTYHAGFVLGPRINAGGRIGAPDLGTRLLATDDAAEAAELACRLDGLNRERQAIEAAVLKAALAQIEAAGDAGPVVIAADSGWHAGVIGIVAGRIAESFGKPTVMIALENGVGQGSARSVRHFPLNEAFAQCREHLLTFGGHAMAAGLRIEAQKVDAFRADFQRRAGQLLHHRDVQPRLDLDDEIDVAALDVRLVEDLAKLEPFGEGNRRPIFASPPLEVMGQPRTVGASGAHLQVTLSDGRRQCKGIAFGQAALSGALHDHRRCRVAFRPIINEWNGRKTVEMQIEDFRIPP
jgi:single-stranded-DNA-specific exonuclease